MRAQSFVGDGNKSAGGTEKSEEDNQAVVA